MDFLDYHLKHLMQSGWSYINDSGDFIKKTLTWGSIPDNAILVTADVVGLYPSILHETGLKALREVLDKREQHTIPTSELIRMADFVLKNNYFEFNGQIKQQFLLPLLVPSLPHPTRVCSWIKLKLLFLKPKTCSLWYGLDILTMLFLSGHMVSKKFKFFWVILMSSIRKSNLLMSQAKKALHCFSDRHQYLHYLSTVI